MQQLEPGFRRTINWNNYQSKATKQTQNQYLDDLVDPSLQGVHRLIVLSLKMMHTEDVIRDIFF